MAEKLRKKFILVSVGSVLVVILLIAGMINISNYSQIHRRGDELLQVLTENDGYFPMEKGGKGGKEEYELPPRISKEAPFSTRYFSIKTNESGTVTAVDTGKVSVVSPSEAIAYGEKVLSQDIETGLMDHYKFLKVEQAYGQLVVFVDCSRDLEFFYNSLQTSLYISGAGVVGVFFLVFFMSKRAVAPIVESYEKQKEFITNVSHELKTPLAIIHANTEVLEIESGENQWTKSIHNQVGRLNVLVGGLISLSRMDEECEVLEKATFSFTQVAEEMAEHFQALGEKSRKTFRFEIQENLMYYGNEESITQLISIILENAVKYAVVETEIFFSLRQQEKKIVLEMKNFADGLDEGNYDQLFQRFYRLEGSRNSGTGGSGIGLSVAKSIVLRHKGRITAQSPDGKTLVIRIIL